MDMALAAPIKGKMRNMSFMLTTRQFLARTKTVTRRLGWQNVKVGELIQGCKKCQGLRPGEKLEKLGVIEVVSVRFEPLSAITQDDVIAEGFPEMTPYEFIEMFIDHMSGFPHQIVTRIEFKYVNEPIVLERYVISDDGKMSVEMP